MTKPILFKMPEINDGVKMEKPVAACYVAVGVRIRIIREMIGLTQGDLAKRAGMSRPSIANIEVGRQRILLDDVERLANALGSNPKHLLKGIWW